jgi:hypothetical protein
MLWRSALLYPPLLGVLAVWLANRRRPTAERT